MRDGDIGEVVAILREECGRFRQPIVTEVSKSRDPFKVLVSTVISLRTKDSVTRESSERLFRLADTPRRMAGLSPVLVGKTIYPAGFYRVKGEQIVRISGILVEKHGGRVPDDLETLLELPGVGRKTANLVLTLGFGMLGICVDTHVHRIAGRLGYVQAKTPEKTEFALREKLPGEYWIELNDLLVSYGQNVCTPLSPFCSRCRLTPHCARVGVAKSR